MSVADVAYEGGPWSPRASHLTGTRVGYHVSHVITPAVYARTTCEQRWSLSRFSKYMPNEPIVWTSTWDGRLWWQTRSSKALEDRLLKMVRKRERGMRGSIAAMAVRLEVSRQALDKAATSLARRGLAMFTKGGRGRYSISVIKSIARPRSTKDGHMKSEPRLTPQERRDQQVRMAQKEWDRFSEEEQDKLRADAYAFRAGLAMSLAEAGCSSVEEYLDLVGVA